MKNKYNTLLYNINVINNNLDVVRKDLNNLNSNLSSHFLVNDKKIGKESVDKSINSLRSVSDDIKYNLITSIKKQLYWLYYY